MTGLKGLVSVSMLLGIIACKGGETPAKLSGNASLRLADGSPISQSATTEYNPYVVKMPDGFLMLVFGSDRSCAGCTAGTQNIFVARSVAAYNNDQKLPAFSNPVVVTVASTPLNYASAITFAATQNGANLRIYLNNAQGIIQYADFLATSGTFNTAGFTSIVNSVWRRLTIVGIDDLGTGIYGRSTSGQVYWLNPAILNIALTPMTSTGLAALARVAPAQSSMQDGYITLQNGSVSTSSYSAVSSTLTKLQATFSGAKVTAKSLSIAHTGNAAGDFIILSAADAGQTAQDLYVIEGITPSQLWSDLSTKPTSGISTMPAAVSGVYAWYEFDGNRNDVSGSGNNAYLPTAPFSGVDPAYTASDRYGVPNSAATFDGSTQYIGTNFVAKCDEDHSVSFWVKTSQTATQKSIMGFQTGPNANPGLRLYMQAGGLMSMYAFYQDSGLNEDNLSGTASNLTAGQWKHVVYVHDRITKKGFLYVDGVAGAETTGASNNRCSGTPCACTGASPVIGEQQWWVGSGTGTNQPFAIGFAYPIQFFSGDLDQVAFFTRKLSAAEIQVLATQ
ncbi:MAG: LamG domain-containing protein [Spirochaetota bacterium]